MNPSHWKSTEKIKSYTIGDPNGFKVRILNYGCTITDIMVPDSEGRFENVVLRLASDEAYAGNHPYIGATVGRYANRIAKGCYSCKDGNVSLSVNEYPHHLHGGMNGFDKKIWKCIRLEASHIELGYTSNDGEEGYPGRLQVAASFEISGDTELSVRYCAVPDKTTPVNITNHCYFNLSGNPLSRIFEHRMQLNAEYYTPSDSSGIPSGDLASISGTIFDFRETRKLGQVIGRKGSGFDVNFVLSKKLAPKEMLHAATLCDPGSGRVLELFTQKPGLQFYTGNGLDSSLFDYQGRPLQKFSGLCLEPQFFPNSPNISWFPSPFILPGNRYDYKTVYRFSEKK
jgi:aldose 1-epimerase